MSRNHGKPQGMHVGSPVPVYDRTEDPTAGVGLPSAMVQTRLDYQTAVAVQVPRDLQLVERAILHEATMMGEDFIYAWEVNDKSSKTGKSRIEGMSIDGALVMMRNWGNCHCPTELTDETATHFVIKSTFIDLERGFSLPRLFRQRKSLSMGTMDRDRAEDISFQICQSKCQRNAIEKGLPQWLQARAIEAAKAAAERRYEDVPKAVADVRKYASALGITDEELERKIGSPFADWLPRDIVVLRSAFRSISKKESTITIEFRSNIEEQKPEPTPTASAPAEPQNATVDFPDLKPEPKQDPPPATPIEDPVVTAPPPPTPPTPPPAPAQEPTFTPPTKKRS